MKIGIIGCRGIPNHYGGFEQFAQQLSAGLLRKGHTVSVYNSHLHPYQEKEWNGVHIIHCKDWENNIGTAGQFMYDLNCINDARRRNFDVLLHLGYTSDSVWHWRWPANTKHLVNMDGMEWKRSKYNRLTRRFLKWAESLAANHADLLIADSTAIKDHLQSRYNKEAVYIPYGAAIFNSPDPSVLSNYHLNPKSYNLVIARMEPENNIEIIIRGHLASTTKNPLLVIGNITNRYGKYLAGKYAGDRIRFPGSIYDPEQVNQLRYYCQLYFHGHSAGGTNPSLLEAMACGCTIAAHHNAFNKAILGHEAFFFSTEADVSALLNSQQSLTNQWREANLEKIRTAYNWPAVIDRYEAVMLDAVAGAL